MRITDIPDVRSISPDSAPKRRREAPDQAVELMERSGKIDDVEAYRIQANSERGAQDAGI